MKNKDFSYSSFSGTGSTKYKAPNLKKKTVKNLAKPNLIVRFGSYLGALVSVIFNLLKKVLTGCGSRIMKKVFPGLLANGKYMVEKVSYEEVSNVLKEQLKTLNIPSCQLFNCPYGFETKLLDKSASFFFSRKLITEIFNTLASKIIWKYLDFNYLGQLTEEAQENFIQANKPFIFIENLIASNKQKVILVRLKFHAPNFTLGQKIELVSHPAVEVNQDFDSSKDTLSIELRLIDWKNLISIFS